MKSLSICMLTLAVCVCLAGCSGGNNTFDKKVEQKKADKIITEVLTSFKNQEILAKANTREEANQIAWIKLKDVNKKALSNKLNKGDQKKLLYLLTTNKAEDLPNGKTEANLLFSKDSEKKSVTFNSAAKTFTYDIERSGFDHKLITLEKQEGVWQIVTVKDPK